jgi:hypothetical protein
MIVAEQVQQTVQREDAKLRTERVPHLECLTPCDARRNDNVPEKSALARRERQDVGGSVLPPVLSVQCTDL